MPLANLGELLLFAIKKETRKVTLPLWLAHYAVSKMTNQQVMPYEQFIGEVEQPEADNGRSKEAILTDFEQIVQADREQRGG